MSMLVWPYKDPAETLDYDIDWSARLGVDTIVTSQWTVITTDGGNIALSGEIFVPTATKVFISGGTPKFNYVVQNTITTANGDTEIETVMLPIRQRM